MQSHGQKGVNGANGNQNNAMVSNIGRNALWMQGERRVVYIYRKTEPERGSHLDA